MKAAPLSPAFLSGVRDYYYLLNRGYSGKEAKKLVADRYQLNATQRVMLFRGIFAMEEAAGRKQKLQQWKGCFPAGSRLAVDGLNVLFTLANYLYGRFLFRANDGWVRDNGELFAKPIPGKILERALSVLLQTLRELHSGAVFFFLDRNYDHCGVVVEWLHENCYGFSSFHILPVINPDTQLISCEMEWVATADSAILSRTRAAVCDPAQRALQIYFSADLPDLDAILR